MLLNQLYEPDFYGSPSVSQVKTHEIGTIPTKILQRAMKRSQYQIRPNHATST